MSLPFQSTKGFKGFLELTNGLKKEDGKIQLNYNSNHFESDSNGQLSFKLELMYTNVKDYGAVGDGQTLDQNSIQNAIDAVSSAGGGTVYFPAGTYMLKLQEGEDSAIICKSNVDLVGEGKGNTILKLDDDVTESGSDDFTHIIQISPSVSDLTVRDLQVDGNNQERGGGLDLREDLLECDGKNITLSNLIVKNSNGEGIDCDLAENLIINSCYVEKCLGNGIHVAEDGHLGAQITNCQLSECSTARNQGMINLRGSQINVSNCRCVNKEGQEGRGIMAHAQGGDHNPISITNCYFETTESWSMFFLGQGIINITNCTGIRKDVEGGGSVFLDAERVNITSCYFAGLGEGNMNRCVEFRKGSGTFIGCTLFLEHEGGTEQCILIDENCSDLIVSDCRFVKGSVICGSIERSIVQGCIINDGNLELTGATNLCVNNYVNGEWRDGEHTA